MGGKSAKTKSNSSGKTEPWAYTLPAVKDFVNMIGGFGGIGRTPDQDAAFSILKNNAAQGNPWAADTARLASDAFNTADRSGIVTGAYKDLQGQLGDYASGKYLDPMSNPQMQAMLQQVGDEAQQRINSQFAAAGRDMSGANQMAVGRGVTAAQLPLLMQEYARQQDNQINAANALYGAGAQTSQLTGALDQLRQQLRGQGIEFGQAALDANNYAANSILDLDQQIKGMPYEDAALLASLLLPLAGLGGQSTSSGTAKTSMSLFSDERLKEDVKEVGKLADGLPVYSYRYKDDPTGKIQIGVMAQEVEKRTPGAVTEDPVSGFKMVDYDEATRKAAEVLRARRAKARKG